MTETVFPCMSSEFKRKIRQKKKIIKLIRCVSLYIFFYKFIYLFIIFSCVGSSFLCEGFLQLRRAGATLHCGARASHYRGLSLRSTGSRRARLSSCGSRAQLLRGMWDPPRPGLKPVSPALAGRFSTTAPPGKPPCVTLDLFLLLQVASKLFPNGLSKR